MYALIGKAVVKGGIYFAKRRYGRQIRLAAALGVASLFVAGYLASREVKEG